MKPVVASLLLVCRQHLGTEELRSLLVGLNCALAETAPSAVCLSVLCLCILVSCASMVAAPLISGPGKVNTIAY